MRYAYVGCQRVEPKKGLRGTCSCCAGELIAKCGQFKIHHWAHKDLTSCDPWWENESKWHRQWKSYFPTETQEYVFTHEVTRERHIADVFSKRRIVLEFQSCSIDPDEIRAREDFYQQLVWVVNGLKNQSDKFEFSQRLAGGDQAPMLMEVTWFCRSKLFDKWSRAKKRVYFDFGTDCVWQLLHFDITTKNAQVRACQKAKFVRIYGGSFSGE